MGYGFDTVIPRKGTYSVKWDNYETFLGAKDLIPLWVADMDFAAPPGVTAALKKRASHPVYGYTARPQAYYDAVISWFGNSHGWHIEKETIHCTPGIVTAVSLAVQTFTRPGDSVTVQTPVYDPFYDCVEKNGRRLVRNPLVETESGYAADLDGLERAGEEGARMLILCNPHNPVGKVWSRDELNAMFDICNGYGMTVVSDEIHGDLTMPGVSYTPACTLSEKAARMTIACTSPSKTFNIPGLPASNIIITDTKRSAAFAESLERLHLGMSAIFSIEAVIAAYSEGAGWLEELRSYLFDNARFVLEKLTAETAVKTRVPDGTYLMWLDFREYGIVQDELRRLLYQKAKIGLSDGSMYGAEGNGFMRMNIACPRPVLEEACGRLTKVLPFNAP